MASLEAIRGAIKVTIEAGIPTLTCYATVAGATNLPAVVPVPSDADFEVAMGRGLDTWEFDLYVLIGLSESGIAQDSLDSYVTGAGEKSIRQCVFANRALGLTDGTSAHVSRMSNYNGHFESAGMPHVGAVLRLIVHTPGKE